jgi:uncharacterized membrane protein YphA (DoxX/SURF4 family)
MTEMFAWRRRTFAPNLSILRIAAASGGLLLLVGLFTRTIAFVLSGEMAFAYFIGHAPMGFWTMLNMGTTVRASPTPRRGWLAPQSGLAQ